MSKQMLPVRVCVCVCQQASCVDRSQPPNKKATQHPPRLSTAHAHNIQSHSFILCKKHTRRKKRHSRTYKRSLERQNISAHIRCTAARPQESLFPQRTHTVPVGAGRQSSQQPIATCHKFACAQRLSSI